jgi:DNA-damage-inducible protein J
MTSKTASVHARIQPLLKLQAEAILHQLGISTSEAIAIYFNQITLQKGLPFDVKITPQKAPNKKTQKALEEARTGKTKRFASAQDLMRDLNA